MTTTAAFGQTHHVFGRSGAGKTTHMYLHARKLKKKLSAKTINIVSRRFSEKKLLQDFINAIADTNVVMSDSCLAQAKEYHELSAYQIDIKEKNSTGDCLKSALLVMLVGAGVNLENSVTVFDEFELNKLPQLKSKRTAKEKAILIAKALNYIAKEFNAVIFCSSLLPTPNDDHHSDINDLCRQYVPKFISAGLLTDDTYNSITVLQKDKFNSRRSGYQAETTYRGCLSTVWHN